MKHLFCFFLTACGMADLSATSPQGVPYPNAQGLGTTAAICPSPDSDCFGAIKISQPYRDGTWTIGSYLGPKFESLLVFNTEEDARKCLGTSRDFRVMVWKDGEWATR